MEIHVIYKCVCVLRLNVKFEFYVPIIHVRVLCIAAIAAVFHLWSVYRISFSCNVSGCSRSTMTVIYYHHRIDHMTHQPLSAMYYVWYTTWLYCTLWFEWILNCLRKTRNVSLHYLVNRVLNVKRSSSVQWWTNCFKFGSANFKYIPNYGYTDMCFKGFGNLNSFIFLCLMPMLPMTS